MLDVQTAANAVMFTQYIAAFLATMWCARCLGLRTAGALLAAIVYVYGWFPARASLDWAILGGLYLPLALGGVAAFWQTRRPRDAVIFSLAIGMQLLGGHYQIAFLTWLLVAAYSGWLWLRPQVKFEPVELSRVRNRSAIALAGAFVLGVGLGSAQLLPTWELKGRSQRAQVGGEHDPAYGHIPPIYLSQVVAPWFWYDPGIDLDAALARLTWLSAPAATNRVEAHLYFGQVPWYLAVGAAIASWRRRQWDRETRFWWGVALFGVIYATGWLLPVLRFVPGFNFFRGPGRAGLLTTLAIAMIAGGGLDRLRLKVSRRWLLPITATLIIATIVDLWWLPRSVTYAVMLPQTPIQMRDQSSLRERLLAKSQPVRLYSPGANFPTVMGVSAVPVYLGLGPEEYFDPALAYPAAEPDDFHTYTPERVAWLRQAGVTHILSFELLERRGWPVELEWAGIDPMLNFGWARFREPIYLYRLDGATGLVVWEGADSSATAVIQSLGNHSVAVLAESSSGGRLVLKELAYPGWEVMVDGQPAKSIIVSGMFRGVDLPPGSHRVDWSYRPRSVYWGFCLSGVAAVLLGLGSLALARRPLV
ncbi:MAG: hypothetical protein B7Z55_06930 [Planctomycetales bacterium 12-60-4]|nr:MAG: hypothetical protein B7Z55_06930 [Planctomycetales bacterium 12-60-4]